MILELTTATYLTNLLLAILLGIQFAEFFFLKSTFSENGMWGWNSISDNYSFFPIFIQKIIKKLIIYPNVMALLAFRQTLIILTLTHPYPGLYLLVLISNLLILSRWKGVFNGGSDYISFIVMTGLYIGSLTAKTEWESAGLFYIAVHSCFSYFKAGLVKVVIPGWRNGSILPLLFKTSLYKNPWGMFSFLNKPIILFLIAWVVLIFELTFPLAMVSPPILILYLFFGCIFHLSIIYFVGLNRFFWAWIATYPSLIYFSLIMFRASS